MVVKLMPGLGNNVPPLGGTSGKSVKNMRMYSAHSDLGLFKMRRAVIMTRPLVKHRVEKQRTSGYYQSYPMGLFYGTGMKIKKHIGHVRVLVDNSHKIS